MLFCLLTLVGILNYILLFIFDFQILQLRMATEYSEKKDDLNCFSSVNDAAILVVVQSHLSLICRICFLILIVCSYVSQIFNQQTSEKHFFFSKLLKKLLSDSCRVNNFIQFIGKISLKTFIKVSKLR